MKNRSMQTQNRYIPGACNIGRSEIKRRTQMGWLGLVLTVVLWGLFVYLDLPRSLRLLTLFPATAAALGFLQARMHFCAYFGIIGVFNFTEDTGRTDTVEQAEFRVKDRRKAWEIIIYSVITGTAVAVLAYYLPS